MMNGNGPAVVAKAWYQRIGSVLIYVGVGMWGVYAVGKYLLGWDISDRQFLPYHLAAIIPGMWLRFYGHWLQRLWRRNKDMDKG